MRFQVSRPAGFVLAAYAFFITMLGATLPTPLYPLLERRYSFGELMVTVVFAVYAFGVIAGLMLFGKLSDQIGRRPLLLLGLGFSAASALLFVFAQSLVPIFVARVASGLSAGVFTGTATATLVDLAPDDRRRYATFVAVVVNLGGLGCGTLLAGVLADHFGSPLRLPFIVNLVLLVPAVIGVLVMPETVARQRFRFQLQRVSVPPEVRGVFLRGATAGLAAFAVSGVFASVAPIFLAQVLGYTSHTLAGFLVFMLLAFSIFGQFALTRMSDRIALIVGCVMLIVGVVLLGLSVEIESLALIIASAAVVGPAQGLVLGAALAAINQRAPVERRSEAASSFFVAVYIGLSLPVIGLGLVAHAYDLKTASATFNAAVAILVLAVLVSLLRDIDER